MRKFIFRCVVESSRKRTLKQARVLLLVERRKTTTAKTNKSMGLHTALMLNSGFPGLIKEYPSPVLAVDQNLL